MILNVINLAHRTDRLESFLKQADEQSADYMVHEGVIDSMMPFKSITTSHKKIVRYAKEGRKSMVCVCEDDIKFSAPGAFDFFLESIPKDFDIFFGMIYEGEINAKGRIVDGFSGMTLYIVHERFYDKFLFLKEEANIDRELGLMVADYKFIVCNPFVAKQADGWSDNKHRYCEYDNLLLGREFYKKL